MVSIALDESVEPVEEMVAEMGMDWPQIAEGEGFESEIVRAFNVRGTPTYFLLDRQGRIAARDLHGPELEAAVEEALDGAPTSSSRPGSGPARR